jgi:hypothetical protein
MTADTPDTPTLDRDMRNISTCWQYAPNGWHAYGAGPCFDTYEAAIKYRDLIDEVGEQEARRRHGL